MTQNTPPVVSAHAPNSCQYTVPTSRGDYLIQVSWPLSWNSDRTPPSDEAENDSSIHTIYLVDGNAYFFTATDIARRLECLGARKTVIVAIGYPVSKYLFNPRRAEDFTPPSADGKYEAPIGRDGKPQTGLTFGGASEFLGIIQKDIMSHVEEKLFPHISLRSGRKALFGHSYGGLFVLNAIFTKPDLFDTYIAASPSIWFNNLSIVQDQEKKFKERSSTGEPNPRLLITVGSGEQNLIQKPGESDDYFKKKKEFAEEKKMIDNAMEMAARLKNSPRLREVWKWEFEGEDHGGASTCGLQRGLTKFLDEPL
ncbi:hypothetical protein G7046_g5874 [Stylonectria norvegica]|nr:hypothetical protein G7046_g5874 [Stylonectria norvegica]